MFNSFIGIGPQVIFCKRCGDQTYKTALSDGHCSLCAMKHVVLSPPPTTWRWTYALPSSKNGAWREVDKWNLELTIPGAEDVQVSQKDGYLRVKVLFPEDEEVEYTRRVPQDYGEPTAKYRRGILYLSWPESEPEEYEVSVTFED